MPVQYEGIIAEHLWTRQHAGLFDVSHMGQLLLSGEGLDAALEALLPIDLATLKLGMQRYSLLLDADGDRTFVVYRNVSVIEAIDHVRFETTSWAVPLGLDHLDLTATAVIATRQDKGSVVHRIDRATDRLDTWALNYPSGELRIAPDGQWAITTPPQSARFELITLEPDGSGRLDTDPRPFGVEGEISDVQFAERDGGTSALMFSGGSNQLLQLDWPALTGSSIEIAYNPVSIGEAPGIGWFITHNDPQGRITLLDLAGEATVVEGFATYAMLEPTLLEKEAQP